MNRFINIILSGLEWLIPILGITRLSKSRIISVILASAAHIVPLIGCLFAGWDPVAVMLAYWIELAFVILILLVILIIIFSFRIAGRNKVTGPDFLMDETGEWWISPSIASVFLFFWFIIFPGELAINLNILGAIAKSHYELESLSAVFRQLTRGFFPAGGGIIAFLDSESASLALMLLSSIVCLYLQFSEKKDKSKWIDKIGYIFAVKPLVRLIAMTYVFGLATAFGAERLPAVVTVATLAFAMALIDQRIELIDNDFMIEGKGDPGFKTPHGALLNFVFQVMLIIMGASFIIQSVVAEKRFERILKNPVAVNGVITGTHLPDEERYSIVAQKYWWFIDVEYKAENDLSKSYMVREVKTLFVSPSDPKGKTVRVMYEAGDPHNAFVDVFEDRQKPKHMLYGGIILMVLGIIAWWAIRIFMRG